MLRPVSCINLEDLFSNMMSMMNLIATFILLFGYFHMNSGFALPLKKNRGSVTQSSRPHYDSFLDLHLRQPKIIAMSSTESVDTSSSNSNSNPSHKSVLGSDLLQNSPVRSTLTAVYHLFAHTQNFFEKFVRSIISDPDLTRLVAKAFSYGFWTFIVLILLGTIGIDTKPLLSLISVLGITIGFAAKDLIKNGFAGLFILFTRPFQRGDLILVGSFKGRVLSVDLRYVKLLSVDGKSEIMVPLSLVYGNAITIQKPEFNAE